MSPLVSVIIPNYNHAPYLRERIDSVMSQTFRDMEVIILDDCSPDSSRDIIETYRGNPMVSAIVYNTANSGTTFAQWKRGLERARGKYVWIAESDDSASPDFLSTLVPLLEESDSAVLAFSGSEIIDSEGNIIPGENWDRFGPADGRIIRLSGRELTRRLLLRNNGIYNASMALFRREAAPEITDEYLKMKFCGDWLFWSRLARRGDAACVCSKLNRFRQHRQKVSNSASATGLTFTEGLPVVEEMVRWLGLTPLQRRVLAGRLCKRLRKFPPQLSREPSVRVPLGRIAGSSVHPGRLIMLYELDKYLHFSKL